MVDDVFYESINFEDKKVVKDNFVEEKSSNDSLKEENIKPNKGSLDDFF